MTTRLFVRPKRNVPILAAPRPIVSASPRNLTAPVDAMGPSSLTGSHEKVLPWPASLVTGR